MVTSTNYTPSETELDFQVTITNLHKEFPDFDLDTLLKIMECVKIKHKMNTYYNYPSVTYGQNTLLTNQVNP